MGRFTLCILAVVVPAVITVDAAAQDPDKAKQGAKPNKAALKSVEVLAGRELTLRPAGDNAFEARVPLRVVPPEALAGITWQTVAIILNGRLLNPGLVKANTDATSEAPRLVLTADLAKMTEAGSYALKIQADVPESSLAAPPVLDFTLTRPAAELQVLAPIRLERTVYLPWVPASWHPTEVSLTERSGKSNVTPVSQKWTCELRGDGGMPAGRLQFALPSSIKYGEQGAVSLEEKEAPALGKSTGSLLVRSPQLATEVFEASVEVNSRVWSFWLLFTIGAGIVAGYCGRTKLEDLVRRQQARVTATERLQVVDNAIGKANDPAIRKDLEAIRSTLQTEISKPTATASSIEAAARNTETALVDRLRKAAEKEAAVRAQLTALRADLGLNVSQPLRISHVLHNATAVLAQAQASLDNGDSTAAEPLVAPLRGKITADLQEIVAGWKSEVDNALARIGIWPDTRQPTVAQDLHAQFCELQGKTEVQAILPITQRIHLLLVHTLLDETLAGILPQARDIADFLGRLQGPKPAALAPALAELRTAIANTEAAQAAASSERLDDVGEGLHKLREAVSPAMAAAVPSKTDGTPGEPLSGLADGNFAAAVKELGKRYASLAERRLGEGQVAREPTEAPPTATAPPAIPSVARGTWDIALDSPGAVTAGRSVTLHARWVVSPGTPVPQANLQWYVNDASAKSDGSQSLDYTLPMPAPGQLNIRVEALAADGQRREARLTLLLAPVAPSLSEAVEQLKKMERQQTIFAGVIIAVVGFLLYRNAFVGDLGDFATAFFWGFSTDIGLAKVRELSAPLLTRFTQPSGQAAGS